MGPTITIQIPANRGPLYLNALNALSKAGLDLNDAAMVLEEAQRVQEAMKPVPAPPVPEAPPLDVV